MWVQKRPGADCLKLARHPLHSFISPGPLWVPSVACSSYWLPALHCISSAAATPLIAYFCAETLLKPSALETENYQHINRWWSAESTHQSHLAPTTITGDMRVIEALQAMLQFHAIAICIQSRQLQAGLKINTLGYVDYRSKGAIVPAINHSIEGLFKLEVHHLHRTSYYPLTASSAIKKDVFNNAQDCKYNIASSHCLTWSFEHNLKYTRHRRTCFCCRCWSRYYNSLYNSLNFNVS